MSNRDTQDNAPKSEPSEAGPIWIWEKELTNWSELLLSVIWVRKDGLKPLKNKIKLFNFDLMYLIHQ